MSQNVIDKSSLVCVKSEKYAFSQTPGIHEARQSRATDITLLGEAKLRYAYQNSLQCSITFPVSVPSSFLR